MRVDRRLWQKRAESGGAFTLSSNIKTVVHGAMTCNMQQHHTPQRKTPDMESFVKPDEEKEEVK